MEVLVARSWGTTSKGVPPSNANNAPGVERLPKYPCHTNMADNTKKTDADGEVFREAFSNAPGPHISYNLPLDQACAKHVVNTFAAERVYILASGSLCRNTKYVQQLQQALGSQVVGTRQGMTPHTLWSECLEVAEECRTLRADILVTLGAGSLTDAAKIVALVSDGVSNCHFELATDS